MLEFEEGYEAYFDGESREDNPYSGDEIEEYEAWENGWIQAEKDNA